MCAKPKDITGKRFGRLVAQFPTELRRNDSTMWVCKCDCGNTHLASHRALSRGSTRSCGCLRMEDQAARWLLKRFSSEEEAVQFVRDLYSHKIETDDCRKRKAAELFEQGLGHKAVATELGLNRETMRDWYETWRALGTDEFLEPMTQNYYSDEIKLAACLDRLKGMSVIDVMRKYHIRNRAYLRRWLREYREKHNA